MNRSFINILFLILVLLSSQLILFSCAGPQEIPESEKEYIEGVVVEGGVNGFRLKDDNDKIIRFYARDKVEYDPLDFHAYYGDRVGVTYYPENKRGKDWHNALRVVLLTTDANRIDFGIGFVDGIIRASGVMRYLVYIPENDLTVAFYKQSKVEKSPNYWSPRVGDKVEVYFSVESGRFLKKLNCYRINKYGENLRSIQGKTETGVITEIFVHRSAKRAPDRFAFQMENGDTLTMYGGGETKFVPKDLKVKTGNSYSIEYYRLLMGDQSLRYVARQIEMARFDEQQLKASGYRLLSGDQVRAAFSDSSLSTKLGKTAYHLRFTPGGRIDGYYRRPSGKSGRINGQWYISNDDLYCDNLGIGGECNRIYLRGHEVVFVKLGGRLAAKAIIEQKSPTGAQTAVVVPVHTGESAKLQKVKLRHQPETISTPAALQEVIKMYGFFDSSTNKHGSFENEFVDNGDGTITDKATGLMWQKGGSSKSLKNRSARKYLKKLNSNEFAGYSDWRIPTIEELASLLQKDKNGGAYLDSVFNNQQIRCWSSDTAENMHGWKDTMTVWVLDYKYGKAKRAYWWPFYEPGWASQNIQFPNNYVKTVRSVKQ